MAFNDIFDFIKAETRKDILANGSKNTPPSISLEMIDNHFGYTHEQREHLFLGTEPIGKINKTAVDVSLTDTEYATLKEDVERSKAIGDNIRRIVIGSEHKDIKALIRAEVDIILREYGLIG